MKELMEFGTLSVKKLCSLLFYIGAAGVLTGAVQLGRLFAVAFPYDQMVQQSNGWYTSQMTDNTLLGLMVGLAALVFGLLLWRLVCEALYIILNYFKNNARHTD